MSLFDGQKSGDQGNTAHNAENAMFHPIDDAKKLMQETASIIRDIRRMVDKAQRAMKIMAE